MPGIFSKYPLPRFYQNDIDKHAAEQHSSSVQDCIKCILRINFLNDIRRGGIELEKYIERLEQIKQQKNLFSNKIRDCEGDKSNNEILLEELKKQIVEEAKNKHLNFSDLFTSLKETDNISSYTGIINGLSSEIYRLKKELEKIKIVEDNLSKISSEKKEIIEGLKKDMSEYIEEYMGKCTHNLDNTICEVCTEKFLDVIV